MNILHNVQDECDEINEPGEKAAEPEMITYAV